MKRLTRIAVLTLAVAALAVVLAFAAGENTLISLSYLNGTYASQLASTLKDKTGDLQAVYDAALEKLSQKTGQAADTSGGWTSTTAFETVYPKAGETVTLSAGSGPVWYSGVGSASAALVDVTAGTELASGGALTAGHRYLADQETVVTASASASCGAEGMWKTTATGAAPVQLPFTDVPDNAWYYNDVAYVAEKGLFNGVNSIFGPGYTMDRSMLVTVLHRLAGEPSVTGSLPFTDVSATAWYRPGVLWGAQTGIVKGYASAFGPGLPVTREQMAVFLYRYASYYGYDVSARTSVAGFSDCGEISSFAQEAMSWAVAVGLFNGNGGKLNPRGSAVRAEVAAIIHRYAQWMETQ